MNNILRAVTRQVNDIQKQRGSEAGRWKDSKKDSKEMLEINSVTEMKNAF